jgi:Tfp pilus assembly protein PilZ
VATQAEPRFKKRIPCRLKVGGESHTAMALNLSKSGLFVQTSAGPPRGASVVVDLDVADSSEAISVAASVVWRRVVAPHLRTISQGGVGLRIESAPEAYYHFLSGVVVQALGTRSSTDGEDVAPEPEEPSDSAGMEFRVRVKQEGGPRSRALVLRGESADDARTEALRIVGRGWMILEVEPLS